MAAFKEPKKFGVIPGNAADVTAIQDAGSVLNPSMADIFPAIYQVPLGQGGKAPERTTFNAFLKLYGEALYFLQRGGVWSYDATADYPAGSVVGYSGSLYLALGENGPGTVVAVLGFLDDFTDVSIRWRLLGHFSSAAWALYWLGGLPLVQVFGYAFDLGLIGNVLAAVYIVWLLNLYNFMDGIDGIASVEAICVCLGGALLYVSAFSRV